MSAAFATLDAVRQATRERHDPAWLAKMRHRVPDLPTVADRARYLVEKVTGEVVLDLGCAGPLSAALRAAARGYYGVDREPGDWTVLDLDVAPERLPRHPDVTLVLAAELLEHLANPGWLLAAVRAAYPAVPLCVTVPHAGAYRVRHGTHEEVNGEHVCWYSYTTLATLLRRTGYVMERARWYHGAPHTAEGLIVWARAGEP